MIEYGYYKTIRNMYILISHSHILTIKSKSGFFHRLKNILDFRRKF